MESHKFNLAHRVDNSLAVWEEFKEITAKYNCISLGEGAPATMPPKFLVDDLMNAINEGPANNQYTRAFGNPALAAKVAEVYGKKLGRKIDPMNEVNIGVGAYFVISDLLMTFIRPELKEEVVVFEPSYPCYYDHIQYAGGVVKGAPLDLKDGKWVLNPESFRKALSPKTKVFIFNNAQNPTGKIFTREEMETIAEILKEFPDVIVMSDEVYDFLTFDDQPFIPYASIGDNYYRTVTVWSGGKLFNATGWKCGWAIGPSQLIKPAGLLTYASIYCSNTPVQVAMSRALDKIYNPGYDKNGLNYVDSVCKEF